MANTIDFLPRAPVAQPDPIRNDAVRQARPGALPLFVPPNIQDGFESAARSANTFFGNVGNVATQQLRNDFGLGNLGGLFGQSSADDQYDGELIGAGGTAFPAGTNIDSIPTFKPNNGKPGNGETVVFVNGISTDKNHAANDAQTIANGTGDSVINLHVSTDGVGADLAHSVEDYFSVGKDKAVDSLTQIIYDHAKSGEPLHLLAHSRGGLVTARALNNAEILLQRNGMTHDQALAAMGNVKVETFASASPWFPDGPKYVHYFDDVDPVSLIGIGHGPGQHPGAGAKVKEFNTWNPFTAHAISNYLSHWEPFDKAYGGQ